MKFESKSEYESLSRQDSDYIEVQVPVVLQTEKAICFDTYNGHLPKEKKVWIPKSQIKVIDMGSEAGIRYFVKKWLHSKLN